jgi:hypothetical protein
LGRRVLTMHLPGMILLPGSFSGKDNSPRPHLGPEPRNRISLAIFIKLQAMTFRAPCNSIIASWAANASNLLGALENRWQDISSRYVGFIKSYSVQYQSIYLVKIKKIHACNKVVYIQSIARLHVWVANNLIKLPKYYRKLGYINLEVRENGLSGKMFNPPPPRQMSYYTPLLQPLRYGPATGFK